MKVSESRSRVDLSSWKYKNCGMRYSIVVPVHNGAHSILKLIQSLQNQRHKDFELIVINDGSTDETVSVLTNYKKKMVNLRVESIFKKNRSAARNFGAAISSPGSQYLIFIDADIVLDTDWLYHVNCYLQACPVDALATRIEPVAKKGYSSDEISRDFIFWKTAGTFLSAIGPDGYPLPLIDTAACAISKKSFQQLKGFDESLSRNEDADFSIRLFAGGYVLGGTEKAKAKEVLGSNSSSQLKSSLDFLKRNFSVRYFHARPKRLRQVLNAYFIRAWFQNAKIRNLPIAMVGQLSFSAGAIANWFLNPNPLNIDLRLRKISSVDQFCFQWKGQKFSLKENVRLLVLNDHFFVFWIDKKFYPLGKVVSSDLQGIMTGKSPTEPAIRRLFKTGVFVLMD